MHKAKVSRARYVACERLEPLEGEIQALRGGEGGGFSLDGPGLGGRGRQHCGHVPRAPRAAGAPAAAGHAHRARVPRGRPLDVGDRAGRLRRVRLGRLSRSRCTRPRIRLADLGQTQSGATLSPSWRLGPRPTGLHPRTYVRLISADVQLSVRCRRSSRRARRGTARPVPAHEAARALRARRRADRDRALAARRRRPRGRAPRVARRLRRPRTAGATTSCSSTRRSSSSTSRPPGSRPARPASARSERARRRARARRDVRDLRRPRRAAAAAISAFTGISPRSSSARRGRSPRFGVSRLCRRRGARGTQRPLRRRRSSTDRSSG